ncbi:MAG: ketoacyl-ACP synthase III [Phycisphaerae bacterium]|nr:ketoacyl-ACP synthase III [Phycisphaerae bacterium]
MSNSNGMVLAGSGYCLPERRLTNQDLVTQVDTTDEWIVTRTGIRERRIAADGQTTMYMAVEAAKSALADAKLAPDQLDAIIVATVTPEQPLPATACLVQAELNAGHCAAFDISAACSGFVYGIVIADRFVRHGGYKNLLLIGSETLSRITDYTDRSSCILFGDGAGAVVLQQSPDAGRGVLYHQLHADGKGADFINVPGGGVRHPATAQTLADRMHYMKMKGRDVYKFAVMRMHDLIRDAMANCNLTIDQVKLIVPHQVNQRIIDSAIERLGISPDKVYVNIDRFGNTSAASVPIALHEARLRGRVDRGDTVILVAFGAGLTWASAVVKL